jgi:hypothetical protein
MRVSLFILLGLLLYHLYPFLILMPIIFRDKHKPPPPLIFIPLWLLWLGINIM